MTDKNRSDGRDFEERLLEELKSVVARRGAEQEISADTAARSPGWRRVPPLALAAAVLAATAALLLFDSGSDTTSRAFAVEAQAGGGVTIKIFSPEDAAGLEGALGEAGIRSQVTWLPAGMTCREPRFTRSTTKTAMGGTIGGMNAAGPAPAMTFGVMSAEQWRERQREYHDGEISEDEYHSMTGNITLDPAEFRPDQTVVVSGSPGPFDGDPEGGYELRFAIAEGPVEPCEPIRMSDGLLGKVNAAREPGIPTGQR